MLPVQQMPLKFPKKSGSRISLGPKMSIIWSASLDDGPAAAHAQADDRHDGGRGDPLLGRESLRQRELGALLNHVPRVAHLEGRNRDIWVGDGTILLKKAWNTNETHVS